MQQPLPWTISPWPHNLSQQASGNPGAVQKAIAVKSTKAPKKSAAKKPAAKKAARRSTADVAKLRKSVIAGSKAKKTAETIAKELGISRAYVYALKRKA